MKTFHLTVSSVTESKFDGEALSVHVPGMDGEMEVLAEHQPMITTLKAGTITVKTKDNKDGEKFVIEKGILEVANNRAVVLV
jgi:F-type H+-transporting ATPase subunit epsilon